MENIDGRPVVSHRVRFRDRAVVPERYRDLVRDGERIVWLVRATCKPPSYHVIDDADRYRLNIQVVEDAIPLDGTDRETAIALLDHDGTAQGLFVDVPAYRGEEKSAQETLDELRTWLDGLGASRDDETLLATIQRLTGNQAMGADSVVQYPQPFEVTVTPEPAFTSQYDPTPVRMDAGSTERIGRLHDQGHRGETSALLDEVFE